MSNTKPAIWFPTVKTNTGTDKFTEQLVSALNQKGFQAEITWLPHHAEYLPWLVPIPEKPDWANVVHINSWLAPRFIPKGIPVVTTVHLCVQDPIIRPYKSLAQHLYHKFWVTPIERYALKRANVVTCVSSYTKSKVENIFNINNVQLVYNGINVEKFKYKHRDKPNKPFRLLFVGTNSMRKGFDLLPLIMDRLGCEYELIFTSINPEAHINLPRNMKPISYRKTQKDLLDLYHDVDVLIFPSRLEGFGLVVAEAMACGLPVVVANSSALTELIDDGVTGFLCAKDDIGAFVEAIGRLANDEMLRKKLANTARLQVEQYFKQETMMENYIKTYQSLLNNLDHSRH